MSRPDYSYAVDGRRVELEPDPDWLLVDCARLGPAQRRRLTSERVGVAGVALGGERWIVRAGLLEGSLRRRLERSGAVSPVFRYGGRTVVVLPAVRAELRRDAEPAAVAARHPSCRWKPWRGRGMEFAPASGSVEDTLAVARSLAADADVVAATPRLVRLDRRKLRA